MAKISADLQSQAVMLAKREPRRPKQATIRRSISTAYYALFHFLIEESTSLLCGAGQNDESLRQLAGRAFVHGKMKTLCREFTKPGTQGVHELLRAFWQPMGISTNAQIRLVAQNFIDLQELRHTADYDLSVFMSRQDALNAAQRVADAMSAWRSLKSTNREVCRLFALALALWPSLASR